MKRILIIAPSLVHKDGINRVVSEMSWHFNDRAMICTNNYDPKQCLAMSPQTPVLKTPDTFDLRSVNALTKLVRRTNIAVLNAHNFSMLKMSCIIKLLSMNTALRISWVIYDRKHLNVFCNLKWRLVLTFLAKIGVINEILVLDNKMANLLRRFLPTQKITIIRIGVSHSMIELYAKATKGRQEPSERIEKILKRNKENVKLFFHGILIPRRRVEDLLTALSLLKNADFRTNLVLYISGSEDFDKSYVNSLHTVIKDLGLEHDVFFLGTLSEEDLAFMYYMSDIFIFPCDMQTWGIALLEAMLFEKPVIVSTGSGVSEVLNENIAILVPPRNPLQIANAILKLAKDKKLRKKIGTAAHNFIIKNLTFHETAVNLREMWDIT